MPRSKSTTKESFGSRKRTKARGRHGGRKPSATPVDRVLIESLPSTSASASMEDNRSVSVELVAEIDRPTTDALENIEERVTSVRKQHYFEEDSHHSTENLCRGYRIVSITSIEELIQSLGCPKCGQQQLKLTEKLKGMAAIFSVYCDVCEQIVTKVNSSKNNEANRTTDINLLTVASSINNGIGYKRLCNFIGGQNIPRPLHLKSFQKLRMNMQTATEKSLEEHFAKVASIIKTEYREIGLAVDDNIANIAVSYDGSWHKRGHSSLFGVGAVIDLMTGLVIDFEVMSKYCHGCSLEKSNYEKYKNHQCQLNYQGSSGAMEVEIALQLFKRSAEKYGLRYLTMLSDGDSKAFLKLKEANVYGDEYPISKEECINHISKRMGSALRKLKETSKQSGIKLGGKGRLTNEKIERIQNYYGKALKDNAPNVENMRNAAYASLFHMVSTDNDPHHTFCPKGVNSWCHYNRALEDPSLKRSHKPTLPKEVAEILLPVYKRLTDLELLKRCTRNKTQNNNESLHSIIWQKCPKGTFASHNTVRTAASLAVMQFNEGPNSFLKVVSNLGIDAGRHQVSAAAVTLKRKLSDAVRFSSSENKLERKRRKIKKLITEDKYEATEGPVYEPGAF